jgi:hypothetical protein
MIEDYLETAIRQAQERAKLLKAKIPQPVKAAEFVALQQLCESRIDDIIRLFEYLSSDPTILTKDLVKERIRIFRRAIGELSQLETSAITALNRVHDDDIFPNKLVFQIHKEINFPLSPPTVTCLSREYFSINPALHLLEVPLAESEFLLHLPDLYHEIAHLLIATTNNPKAEPVQQALGQFLFAVAQHFDKERTTNLRATGPTDYFAQVFDLLERFWIPWATEIFCDLFAIYTLGPAYAWSHFHLTAEHGGDPYDIRLNNFMSHPPDQARMEAMLMALDILDFKKQASDIKEKWNSLVKSIGAEQTPMYRRACPSQLIQQAVTYTLDGVKKIGCRVVSENTTGMIHDLLNTAWQQFWVAPNQFPAWERQTINTLKQMANPWISHQRGTT